MQGLHATGIADREKDVEAGYNLGTAKGGPYFDQAFDGARRCILILLQTRCAVRVRTGSLKFRNR